MEVVSVDAVEVDGDAARVEFCDSCRIVWDDRCRRDAILDRAGTSMAKLGPRL
jgi:Zn-finger nucleic acid-binding protein